MAELSSFGLGVIFIVAGVLLLLVELTTPGFFVSVPATVLMVLGAIFLVVPDIIDSWFAIPILLVVSVASLMVTMKGYEKLAPPDKPPYGSLALIVAEGSHGHVVRTVEPASISGRVKIKHREWAATAEKRIPVGTKVKVVKGEGVHLEVEEVED